MEAVALDYKKMEREKSRADFHVHFSDRSTESLLQEALDNQVSTVAVLDRGIVKTEKLKELITEGEKKGLTIVPGVECLTEVRLNGDTISLELLGLDFNLDNPEIYANFDPHGEFYLAKHNNKVAYQKAFLESQGFILNHVSQNNPQWETLRSGQVLDTAIRLCRIAATEPKNVGLFQSMETEINKHMERRPQDKPKSLDQEALSKAKFLFWKYFAQGQPGFRRWQLDFETIVDAIHSAHGIVIIPHPSFQHKEGGINIYEALDRLFEMGVDGIECWDADLLNKGLARKTLNHGKLVLGGSGKDATYYANRAIGLGDVEKKRMYISPNRLRDIRNYKEQNPDIFALNH